MNTTPNPLLSIQLIMSNNLWMCISTNFLGILELKFDVNKTKCTQGLYSVCFYIALGISYAKLT